MIPMFDQCAVSSLPSSRRFRATFNLWKATASAGRVVVLLAIASVSASTFGQDAFPHITTGPILGRLSAHGIGVWARTSRESAFQVRYRLAPDKMDQITELVVEIMQRRRGYFDPKKQIKVDQRKRP